MAPLLLRLPTLNVTTDSCMNNWVSSLILIYNFSCFHTLFMLLYSIPVLVIFIFMMVWMFLLHYYVDEKYTMYIFLTKYQFGKYLYFTFSPKLNKFLLKRKKKTRCRGQHKIWSSNTIAFEREKKFYWPTWKHCGPLWALFTIVLIIYVKISITVHYLAYAQ